LFYFGGQNAAQLLTQFSAMTESEAYDLVLVLTDSSGCKLLADVPPTLPTFSAPLWMIHLGGLSLGYDDATLGAIQGSGGGTAVSLTEALHRWATPNGDLLDGYTWQLLTPAQAEAALAQLPATLPVQQHSGADPFVPLAARQLILHEMAAANGNLQDLATLDALHALAIEHSIVTPYSSMIVLVNTRQQELLDELSQGDDRFDREFEEVAETDGVTITGVPEPHEWLLLFLAGLLLLGYLYQQRRAIALPRL
jgi:putative PEP-CTERM system integral membrane protein